MQFVEIAVICGVAFFMVFLILTLLALVMRLIILFFPEKKAVSDAAMIAAITASIQTVFPGKKVTTVEERK